MSEILSLFTPGQQATTQTETIGIIGPYDVPRGYPVRSLLPTEFELVERDKVSRKTVRMALRRFEEIGEVSHRQGSGLIPASSRKPMSQFDLLFQHQVRT
jgi:DNA-binding FadR family transcriptional regulator